jgi:hypothetical protein
MLLYRLPGGSALSHAGPSDSKHDIGTLSIIIESTLSVIVRKSPQTLSEHYALSEL